MPLVFAARGSQNAFPAAIHGMRSPIFVRLSHGPDPLCPTDAWEVHTTCNPGLNGRNYETTTSFFFFKKKIKNKSYMI